MKPIRSITGSNVPIYAWQSASTSACLCLFGPEYLGGHGDLAEKLEKIVQKDEKAQFNQAQKVFALNTLIDVINQRKIAIPQNERRST